MKTQEKVFWALLFALVIGLALSLSVVRACPVPQECPDGMITVEEAKPIYETQCEWVKHKWGWIVWWTWECEDILVGYTDPVCRLPVSGCMDETALNFDPEAEVDAPEMCLYPCIWQQYVLIGENGRTCYIQRNFGRGDSADKLPALYNGTQLMKELCSKTCTGKELSPFNWTGKWFTTCAVCDGECAR